MDTNMKMPVVFAGHGSPMNAVEDNDYSESWKQLGKNLPRPDAILSVSAHWVTEDTRICTAARPKVEYDMYGFPEELYKVKYDAPGSPELAEKVQKLFPDGSVKPDTSWGIDHGTWSVLHRMYPDADIPVVQVSISSRLNIQQHYAFGQALKPLREQGILIFASGNVVHNLSLVNWDMPGGFSWARQFDDYIRDAVKAHRFSDVLQYQDTGEPGRKAVPTPEHFIPLLYALGAGEGNKTLEIFNNSCCLGALSMTGYVFS